ncbi:MAG: hypothetical protein PHG97_01790 [Candidatus Margulisbacteria bacterium]|nr:hypothetical protein [Candidatus Margulisiibacteriota bacterium]
MLDLKKIILLLIVLPTVMVAAALPAKAVDPYFNALYWLKGKVTINGPGPTSPAALRKVVFYQVLPGTFTTINVAAMPGPIFGSFNYWLNIYDNALLPIDPAQEYWAAVARDPNDNYGANPQKVVINVNGFNEINFTLAYGEGPILIEDNGLVRNTVIERDGADIKLSWSYDPNSSVTKADIWRQAGQGISHAENVVPGGIDWTLVAKGQGTTWKDANQVGNNTNAYYRVVPADTVIKQVGESLGGNLQIFLQSNNAKTVGKVDVQMTKGWNSVSSPFINKTFGGNAGVAGDGFGEGDTVSFWGEDIQNFELGFRYSATNHWVIPNNENYLVPGRGCMFNIANVANPPLKVTLIGEISGFDVGKDIKIKWNDVGNPFPRLLDAGGFYPVNLTTTPPNLPTLVEGDTIQSWNSLTQNFEKSMRWDNTAKVWQTSFGFNPGEGYWLNHVSTANQFHWTVKK